MIHPTVHMNGTSRGALLEQYAEAAQAVDLALSAVVENDAEGPRDAEISDGFCFEKVTEGEEIEEWSEADDATT